MNRRNNATNVRINEPYFIFGLTELQAVFSPEIFLHLVQNEQMSVG